MEKEIKEILDYLKDEDEYYKKAEEVIVGYDDLIVEKEDINKLLDYITNLQEELQYQREAELEYNEKHIKLMQKCVELQENYERIYNENCILREKHNITDSSLLDENYNLRVKNEKLKERIEYLERSNDRREDEIISLRLELYGQGSE